VIQGDNYTNDYFLGKREDPYHDSLLGSKLTPSHPMKKLITPTSRHRSFRPDEHQPLIISNPLRIPPIEQMREELQTPRPALNISLIDKTYTYNDVINNMWEDPDSHKDQIFASSNAVEDPLNEFHFRDDI
jgi:hypothetical protein